MTRENQLILNALCNEIDRTIERLKVIQSEVGSNCGYTYAIGGAILGLVSAVRDNREAYARYVARMEQRARNAAQETEEIF